MSFQPILGFSRRIFKYCPKCRIMYNSTNKKDVDFHSKLHKRNLIPKCEKVCKDFYRKGNIFYYGTDEIKAKCTVKVYCGIARIDDVYYDSTTSKDHLFKNIKLLFPEIIL